MVQRDRGPFKEFGTAFKYLCTVGWCSDTKSELNNFKILMPALSDISRNMVNVLDGFMRDRELLAFLVLHSVFRVDARTHGDFIEMYMASKLRITDEQAIRPFQKTIPDEIKKQFALFDIEPIPFELYPYRVEYGCRQNHETGEMSYNPINVIDIDWEIKKDAFKPKEFLSQYDDIVL